MPVDRRAQVGDVIVGSFERGRRTKRGTILVGDPQQNDVGEKANDPSRSSAFFLVTTSGWNGEGAQRTWRVYAMRLSADESFDPQGEKIMFQQGGRVPFQADIWISGRFIEEDAPVVVTTLRDPESDYDEPDEIPSEEGKKSSKKKPSLKPGGIVLVCSVCQFKQAPPEGADAVKVRNMPCPICVDTIGSNRPMQIRKMEA